MASESAEEVKEEGKPEKKTEAPVATKTKSEEKPEKKIAIEGALMHCRGWIEGRARAGRPRIFWIDLAMTFCLYRP